MPDTDFSEPIKLYRRRFIPDENVLLDKDKLIYINDDTLLTSWDTLKPRTDFAKGVSLYFRTKGFKISHIRDSENTFLFWYCDIIREKKTKEGLVFEDMLVDIIVYPDGRFRVVDLDEAVEARRQGLITEEDIFYALNSTQSLLNYIYAGTFDELTEPIRKFLETEEGTTSPEINQ